MLSKCFLSHKSEDKRLVTAVADHLSRRGILCWLDKQQLVVGSNLENEIVTAINNNTAFAIFISKEALESDWVNQELNTALELEKSKKDWILPVFLGNPKKLINSHPLLKKVWLNEAGNVN